MFQLWFYAYHTKARNPGNTKAVTNQEFYFNSPDVILKLYNIYCCSFYGSSIWDLSSQCVSKLYTAWNSAIRIFLMYLEISIGT